MTYLFDHFAHAEPETPTDEGMFARFSEPAEYEGVGMKISQISRMSDADFSYVDMHHHIRWLLDEFGREWVV